MGWGIMCGWGRYVKLESGQWRFEMEGHLSWASDGQVGVY